MAAAIEEKTGEAPELVKGRSGVFDVFVDGELIYSKANTGRFPEHREVLDQV
ncbi:MAG: SelT/SelW/SelH family protein [Myxococcales bacterium]|nr:SelT/SelW/SelH family protein [Myxococcales bacterium]